MAEVCDGGFVQPANESLLDHPLMRYDDQLFEDGGETGLKLPNQIYDSHDQKIKENNQTPITNMQCQTQHQKTRKQSFHRYCCNCFRNTQHACWTCCTKCCDYKCSDGDCCDLKSCSDCCDSCYDHYVLYYLRYQFGECYGYCFLPCITLIRWTGGIFAMMIVMVTVILITLIAYSAIDCINSSIPTIVALGTVLVLTGVCICTFKYDMRREGLYLFLTFIGSIFGIIFVAAVVIDSVYIFNADDDSEQQSTTTICNRYDNIVYIALSYFYALIVFTCCGCGCTYCLRRCRRFRR